MKKIELVESDPYLEPYLESVRIRIADYKKIREKILSDNSLYSFASAHLYYGIHKENGKTVVRDWAPNAESLYLLSEVSGWKQDEKFRFRRINSYGDWELVLDKDVLTHGSLYKYYIVWPGGEGERLPPYARRVVQDKKTNIFSAQMWQPDKGYRWSFPSPVSGKDDPPVIYEAHIGMASEKGEVGTFRDFERDIVPRIVDGGYNAVQIMALMEHPYYGSFGYQVSNFFALSSRYGTPEDFKSLVDSCHSKGLKVIMDIIHSHSVKNENEGLSRYDGSVFQYFHEGSKGEHPAWDSRLFDYGKPAVLHFLLSNCIFWIDEYKIDGFRFDGVTSMVYRNHGLESSFTNYNSYFSDNTDNEALSYLTLANELVHSVNPDFISIAEDMSGYPGMAYPVEKGGIGFDYRLGMGIPDFWIKLIKEKRDEEWNMDEIWSQLNNRRGTEKNIGYCESHDQALVGDKTIAFRLMDSEMYDHMSEGDDTFVVSRGMALHKIIRLLTFTAAGEGYMNFMGNEFGHPEWVDFPREGNNWSYHYARRQWSLRDNKTLKYRYLSEFDRVMIKVCRSVLNSGFAELIKIHNSDHILAYKRGELYFFVNLDPEKSYTDYGFKTKEGGYSLVLNSDSPDFGGYDRIPESIIIDTVKSGDDSYLPVYIPARTALVFRINDTKI